MTCKLSFYQSKGARKTDYAMYTKSLKNTLKAWHANTAVNSGFHDDFFALKYCVYRCISFNLDHIWLLEYEKCDLNCFFIVAGVCTCLVPSCICCWWCARQMRHRDGRCQRFNIANQRISQMIATSSEEYTTYPEGYNPVPQENPDPCNDATNSHGVHVYINPVNIHVPPYADNSQT